MRDKQLKANIKKTRDFIDLWIKFHDLYKNATKKDTITQEEENIFLETKSMVTDKYKSLKTTLGDGSQQVERDGSLQSVDNTSREPSPKKREPSVMMDVISHVLSLKGMAAMSDKALDKLEESWKHSYVFLNKALKKLENQNQGLAKRKLFFEFLKKIFSKKVIQIIILVLIIFIMFYAINVVIRLLVK